MASTFAEKGAQRSGEMRGRGCWEGVAKPQVPRYELIGRHRCWTQSITGADAYFGHGATPIFSQRHNNDYYSDGCGGRVNRQGEADDSG